MTSLWLITESEGYYPCSGAMDFVSVHDNEQLARITFEARVVPQRSTAHLIRLDSDGTIEQLAEKFPVR